jgi:hypothetical protein
MRIGKPRSSTRVRRGGGSVFWFTVSATGVTLSPDDLTALTGAA